MTEVTSWLYTNLRAHPDWVFAAFALGISVAGFIVSVVVFLRDSDWSKRRRDKKEHLNAVFSRSVMVWEQLLTISAAKAGAYHLDSYFYPSYKRNIHRLEEALDGAFSIGMFGDVCGVRENAISLYVAFVQSLVHLETLDQANVGLDVWAPLHFTMGMTRILDQCMRDKRVIIPKDLRKKLEPPIQRVVSQAWTYLEKEPVR